MSCAVVSTQSAQNDQPEAETNLPADPSSLTVTGENEGKLAEVEWVEPHKKKKKKKKKKPKSKRGLVRCPSSISSFRTLHPKCLQNKPTGFEEYYVDAPITPEEFEKERELYDV